MQGHRKHKIVRIIFYTCLLFFSTGRFFAVAQTKYQEIDLNTLHTQQYVKGATYSLTQTGNVYHVIAQEPIDLKGVPLTSIKHLAVHAPAVRLSGELSLQSLIVEADTQIDVHGRLDVSTMALSALNIDVLEKAKIHARSWMKLVAFDQYQTHQGSEIYTEKDIFIQTRKAIESGRVVSLRHVYYQVDDLTFAPTCTWFVLKPHLYTSKNIIFHPNAHVYTGPSPLLKSGKNIHVEGIVEVHPASGFIRHVKALDGINNILKINDDKFTDKKSVLDAKILAKNKIFASAKAHIMPHTSVHMVSPEVTLEGKISTPSHSRDTLSIFSQETILRGHVDTVKKNINITRLYPEGTADSCVRMGSNVVANKLNIHVDHVDILGTSQINVNFTKILSQNFSSTVNSDFKSKRQLLILSAQDVHMNGKFSSEDLNVVADGEIFSDADCSSEDLINFESAKKISVKKTILTERLSLVADKIEILQGTHIKAQEETSFKAKSLMRLQGVIEGGWNTNEITSYGDFIMQGALHADNCSIHARRIAFEKNTKITSKWIKCQAKERIDFNSGAWLFASKKSQVYTPEFCIDHGRLLSGKLICCLNDLMTIKQKGTVIAPQADITVPRMDIDGAFVAKGLKGHIQEINIGTQGHLYSGASEFNELLQMDIQGSLTSSEPLHVQLQRLNVAQTGEINAPDITFEADLVALEGSLQAQKALLKAQMLYQGAQGQIHCDVAKIKTELSAHLEGMLAANHIGIDSNGYLVFQHSSHVDGDDVNLKSKVTVLNGRQKARFIQIITEGLEQGETGQMSAAENIVIAASVHAKIAGLMQADQQFKITGDEIRFTPSATVVAQQADLSGQSLTFEGKLHAQSLTAAFEKVDFTAWSRLNVKDRTDITTKLYQKLSGMIQASTLSLDSQGYIYVDSSDIYAQKVSAKAPMIEQTGHVTTKVLDYLANELKLLESGRLTIEQQGQIIARTQLRLSGLIEGQGHFDAYSQKLIFDEISQIKTIAGVQLQGANARLEGTIDTQALLARFDTLLAQGYVHAPDAQLLGELELKIAGMLRAQKLVLASNNHIYLNSDARVSTDETTVQGLSPDQCPDVEVSGHIRAEMLNVFSKNFELALSGQLNAQQSMQVLASSKMLLEGLVNGKSHLALKAQEITLSPFGTLECADGVMAAQAQERIDLSGTVKSKELSIACQQFKTTLDTDIKVDGKAQVFAQVRQDILGSLKAQHLFLTADHEIQIHDGASVCAQRLCLQGDGKNTQAVLLDGRIHSQFLHIFTDDFNLLQSGTLQTTEQAFVKARLQARLQGLIEAKGYFYLSADNLIQEKTSMAWLPDGYMQLVAKDARLGGEITSQHLNAEFEKVQTLDTSKIRAHQSQLDALQAQLCGYLDTHVLTLDAQDKIMLQERGQIHAQHAQLTSNRITVSGDLSAKVLGVFVEDFELLRSGTLSVQESTHIQARLAANFKGLVSGQGHVCVTSKAIEFDGTSSLKGVHATLNADSVALSGRHHVKTLDIDAKRVQQNAWSELFATQDVNINAHQQVDINGNMQAYCTMLLQTPKLYVSKDSVLKAGRIHADLTQYLQGKANSSTVQAHIQGLLQGKVITIQSHGGLQLAESGELRGSHVGVQVAHAGLAGKIQAKLLELFTQKLDLLDSGVLDIQQKAQLISETTAAIEGLITGNGSVVLQGDDVFLSRYGRIALGGNLEMTGKNLSLDGQIAAQNIQGQFSELVKVGHTAHITGEDTLRLVGQLKADIYGYIRAKKAEVKADGTLTQGGTIAAETIELVGRQFEQLESGTLTGEKRIQVLSDLEATFKGITQGQGDFGVKAKEAHFTQGSTQKVKGVAVISAMNAAMDSTFEAAKLVSQTQKQTFGKGAKVRIAQSSVFDGEVRLFEGSKVDLKDTWVKGKALVLEDNTQATFGHLHVPDADHVRLGGDIILDSMSLKARLLQHRAHLEAEEGVSFEADTLDVAAQAVTDADIVKMVAHKKFLHQGDTTGRQNVFVKSTDGIVPLGTFHSDGWISLDSAFTEAQVLDLLANSKGNLNGGIYVVADVDVTLDRDVQNSKGLGGHFRSLTGEDTALRAGDLGVDFKTDKDIALTNVFGQSQGDIRLEAQEDANFEGKWSAAASSDAAQWQATQLISKNGAVNIKSGRDINTRAVQFSGEQGVHLDAGRSIHDKAATRSYSWTTSEQGGFLWLWNKTKHHTETQTQASQWHSNEGSVVTHASGDCLFEGTKQSAGKGVYNLNRDDGHMEYLDVKGLRSTHASNKLFGLFETSSQSRSDNVVRETAVLTGQEKVHVQTKGKVTGHGIVVLSPDVLIRAKRLSLSGVEQQHKTHEESFGFYLTGAARNLKNLAQGAQMFAQDPSVKNAVQNPAASAAGFGGAGRVLNGASVLTHVENNNALDKLAAGYEIYAGAKRVAGMVQNIRKNGANAVGQALQVTDAAGDFAPAVGFGLSYQKDEQESTTHAPAQMQANHVVLDIEEDIELIDGVNIDAETGVINARELLVKGAQNHSKHHHEGWHLEFTREAEGMIDVEAGYETRNQHRTTGQQSVLNFAGHLETNIDSATLDNATLRAQSLGGQLHNLTIISRTDSHQGSHENGMIGGKIVDGAFIPNRVGYGEGADNGEYVNATAALDIEEGIDGAALGLKKVNLQGGLVKVGDQATLDLTQTEVIAEGIDEHDDSHHNGFNVCVGDKDVDISVQHQSENSRSTFRSGLCGGDIKTGKVKGLVAQFNQGAAVNQREHQSYKTRNFGVTASVEKESLRKCFTPKQGTPTAPTQGQTPASGEDSSTGGTGSEPDPEPEPESNQTPDKPAPAEEELADTPDIHTSVQNAEGELLPSAKAPQAAAVHSDLTSKLEQALVETWRTQGEPEWAAELHTQDQETIQKTILEKRAALEQGAHAFLKKVKLDHLCFTEETLVLTETGFKPIAWVHEGEKVLSRAAPEDKPQWQPVQKVFKNTVESLIELRIQGQLTTIRATANHPFAVARESRTQKQGGSDSSNSDEDPEPEPESDPESQTSFDWVAAGDLVVGDILLDADNQQTVVEETSVYWGEYTTYNLHVAESHSYFVAAGAMPRDRSQPIQTVWVHNCDGETAVAVVDGLSDVLAVKGWVEAAAGYDSEGNPLSACDRALRVIPFAKALKAAAQYGPKAVKKATEFAQNLGGFADAQQFAYAVAAGDAKAGAEVLGNQARGRLGKDKLGKNPQAQTKTEATQACANTPAGQGSAKPHQESEAQKSNSVTDYPQYNYWTRAKEFQGNKVYQRDDLFDPHQVDDRGRTNIQRMKIGRAPQCRDGKPINLHHMIQRHEGAIAEVTHEMHTKDSKILHINSNKTPSGIDRKQFDQWKRQYWKDRAKEFERGAQ